MFSPTELSESGSCEDDPLPLSSASCIPFFIVLTPYSEIQTWSYVRKPDDVIRSEAVMRRSLLPVRFV